MQISVKPARRDGSFLSIKKAKKTYTIHSRYAPQKEAETWAEDLADLTDRLVLFGAGLGYLPRALEQRGVDCYVLEPLPAFDYPADLPLNDLYQGKQVIRFDPSEPIESIIRRIPLKFLAGSQPNIHPGYRKIFPQLESLIEDFLTEGMGVLRGAESHYRFFHQWFDNFIENASVLEEGYSLEALSGAFMHQPGVLVGAGPSLDHSFDLLRDQRNRLLIVTVDTALYSLEQNGISPDFVVSVDPQPENTQYLDDVEFQSHFVGALTCQPAYFNACQGQLFPFYIGDPENETPMFPLLEALIPLLEGPVCLPAAGSVSTTAFALLRYFGCDPIMNVGVDHAFTFHQATPRSSRWAQQQLSSLSRFRSLAGAHLQRIFRQEQEKDRILKTIEGKRGHDWWTTDEYVQQNRWFELQAQDGNRQCVDLREDGMPMESWEEISAEEFIESVDSLDKKSMEVVADQPLEIQTKKLIEWTRMLADWSLEKTEEEFVRDLEPPSNERVHPLMRPLFRYLQTQDVEDPREMISTHWKKTGEQISRLKEMMETLKVGPEG